MKRSILDKLVFIFALAAFGPAHADNLFSSNSDSGRITVMEENDYFASNDDRHYTQGARASYLSGGISSESIWDQPYDWIADNLPL